MGARQSSESSPSHAESVVSDSCVGYGGDFSWVDAHYKMIIPKGRSPLQWLNALTKRLLVLEDLFIGNRWHFFSTC